TLRELHDLARRFVGLGERLEPEHAECATKEIVVTPLVHDRERRRSVEVVVERFRKPLPRALWSRDARAAEYFAKALRARGRCPHYIVREVERLAPVPREVEDEQRFASPDVEHLAERDDVPDRLRHLLLVELEHAVVHPDPRKGVPERRGLSELVLVMREAEVR